MYANMSAYLCVCVCVYTCICKSAGMKRIYWLTCVYYVCVLGEL